MSVLLNVKLDELGYAGEGGDEVTYGTVGVQFEHAPGEVYPDGGGAKVLRPVHREGVHGAGVPGVP